MNFFEAQDQARKRTFWLVLLFALAVTGLVLLTNLFLLSMLVFVQTKQVVVSPETLYYFFTWKEFTLVSVGVCLFILGGSLYKAWRLNGGGPKVASMLGGRLVSPSTPDPKQRQLLNVVEEMAIAAGMPIPQVYLLDESSINAFAAGKTPATSVIGITRGAVARLSRDELQGVVAHEFSHIANGDMRLNIRLVGILHGILLIGMAGYMLFHSLRFASLTRSSKGIGAFFVVAAIGFGLMIIGYAGSFFGQSIKAIVSRQREYLADSSAVQFTRNSEGIAGALKKIGGSDGVGSYLDTANAAEFSHAYFANGIGSFWQAWFATHPPLERRIRRIEPGWDGEFLPAPIVVPEPEPTRRPADAAARIPVVDLAVLSSAEQAIAQVGSLNEQNVDYVHRLIVELPAALREAAQDVDSAQALILSILVAMQANREAALAALDELLGSEAAGLARRFLPAVDELDEESVLPLLELGANALRELAPDRFLRFRQSVDRLISSDRKLNLAEWILQRFVVQQLDEHFGYRKPAKSKYAGLETLATEVATLLTLIALVERREAEGARAAFAAGAEAAGMAQLEPLPREAIGLAALDRSLDRLMQLKPLAKPKLLKACIATILHHGKASTRGIELVRTISMCLDCPMPPLRLER